MYILRVHVTCEWIGGLLHGQVGRTFIFPFLLKKLIINYYAQSIDGNDSLIGDFSS